MNNQPPFTIRIRTEQDQDMDWMVQPNEITFLQAIEVISQVLPQTTITAFEYEDDEGDRITVRSDDEMKAMFETYFSSLSETDLHCGLLPPLIVYPRVGKTPQNRNKFGLKINTQQKSATKPVKTIGHLQKSEPPVESQAAPVYQSPPPPVPHATGVYQPPPPPVPHATGVYQPPPPPVSHATGVYQPPPPTVPHATGAPTMIVGNSGWNITEQDLDFLQLIGQGNGGKVYKALHKPTSTIMAVKVIKLEVDADIQAKILSELQILSKCQSPVIIDFYQAFFVEDRISICTEFMDGGALDIYGPIPEPVLGRMTVFILQGLYYMWSLKILHRDIKPSNILVNTQGQVKLCDFGVSRQLERSITDTYIGTNAYMAPERIRGEEYSTPAEVWSLGICLLELAIGRFPYGDQPKNVTELMNLIVSGVTPRLPQGMFSEDFIHFVTHCMQKNPSQRLTPEGLINHPFIQRHSDGNVSVIAAWIQSRLQQKV